MKSLQKIFIFTFWGVFMPFIVWGQRDSTLQLQSITIKGHHFEVEQHQKINRQEIDEIAPIDLGELLQYMTGITIKNYGGVGSMKTLSYRGMGGEHTRLLIDGTPVSNPQSGQINFANIPTNTALQIQLVNQGSDKLLPVSALVKGNVILLNTFNQSFSPHLLSLRSTLSLGSFGQKEGFLALKKGGATNFISLSGNYRKYEGDYPYRLPFGQNDNSSLRRNNAMRDYSLALGTGFRWKTNKTHQVVKAFGKIYDIQQELPGAVVLYNNLARATLSTKRIRTGITYQLHSKKFDLSSFFNYAYYYLHYHDSNYLNTQGYLDNLYATNSLSGGIHARYKWRFLSFHLGDAINADAMTNNRNLGLPQRISNTAMAKIRFNQTYFYVEAGLFHQLFYDYNTAEQHRAIYTKIHPQIGIYTSDKLLKDFQFYIWYKPSSRAPSFNELYYSQIGNLHLNPEEANQINLGVHFIKKIHPITISITGNVFKNKVKNKILSLPTKNLFVWSIQNIGEVNCFGGDLQFQITVPILKNWEIKWQAGASYQKVLDVSDSGSPSYKDQIAYTPQLTGNTLFSIRYKTFGIHFSGLYIGDRYSLNENILANYLPSYFVFDVAGSYALKLKEKHHLKIYLGIKNIGDNSYNFVRYFVAPPRNYYLKISYAFH